MHARVDPAAGEYYDADIAVEGYHFAVTGNLLHKMFALRMIQELEVGQDEAQEEEEEDDEDTENEEVTLAAKIKRLEQVEALALQYGLASSRTVFVAVETASRKELPTKIAVRSARRHLADSQLPNGQSGCGGGRTQWTPNGTYDYESRVDDATEVPPPQGADARRKSSILLDTRRRSSSSTVLPEDVGQLSDKRAVLFLASLQAAGGSFGPDERLDRLANLSPKEVDEMMADIEGVGGTGGLDPLYTALAVALLEQRYPGQAASWQLIVEKARRWLVKAVDDKAAELLDRAMKVVRQPPPALDLSETVRN